VDKRVQCKVYQDIENNYQRLVDFRGLLTELDEKMLGLGDYDVKVLRRQRQHIAAAAAMSVQRCRQNEHHVHTDHQRRRAPTDGVDRRRAQFCHRPRRHGPRLSHFL